MTKKTDYNWLQKKYEELQQECIELEDENKQLKQINNEVCQKNEELSKVCEQLKMQLSEYNSKNVGLEMFIGSHINSRGSRGGNITTTNGCSTKPDSTISSNIFKPKKNKIRRKTY